MMKIITIVSAAMAAFVAISCAAQTPTPVVTDQHHGAVIAIIAVKPEPKLVEYSFQCPDDWKERVVAGVPVAVSPTSQYRSVNWVFQPNVVIDAAGIEAGVKLISAAMPGMKPNLSSLKISKEGMPGERYFTAKFQMSYQGNTRELRQAYHEVSGGCYVTTFTYEVGDKDAKELWELLQQPPTPEEPQRLSSRFSKELIESSPLLSRMVSTSGLSSRLSKELLEPSSFMSSDDLVDVLLHKQQPPISKLTMAEEMAQREADHQAHARWYKPWTW